MFGEKLELITMRCCVCRKWIALRVDPQDLECHRSGVLVQHAFVRLDGEPYMSAAERELFVSGVCGDCWPLLCGSDPLEFC